MGIIRIHESCRMWDLAHRIGRTINVRIRIKLRRGALAAPERTTASGRPIPRTQEGRKEGLVARGRYTGGRARAGYL